MEIFFIFSICSDIWNVLCIESWLRGHTDFWTHATLTWWSWSKSWSVSNKLVTQNSSKSFNTHFWIFLCAWSIQKFVIISQLPCVNYINSNQSAGQMEVWILSKPNVSNARSNFRAWLCLSIVFESPKKVDITSGCSTKWTQTFPWSSVYFISYSFPGLVDPALAVATKKCSFSWIPIAYC
jgi:hypothetical protein